MSWVHPNDRKSKVIWARVTEEQHKLLQHRAAAAGYPKTGDYVRHLIEEDLYTLIKEEKSKTP